MADVAGRPDWSALRNMVSDLRRATTELPEMQKRMLAVTGTAWSPDRMIKAVVGPRGHLMELEIDPRILRRPNSKALAAGIVQTVRAAIEEAGRQSNEVLNDALPSDLRALAGTDVRTFVGSHDTDVRKRLEDDDHG